MSSPITEDCESAKDDIFSNREKIARKYLRGEGIEIGALHQPLKTSKQIKVHYVDRFSNEGLFRQYPELENHLIVTPDIIDDAQTLSTIKESEYDFCIVNHVLEHMNDPINAILCWMRILKPGGILYLSVPNVNNPLDTGREITLLNHLIQDACEKNRETDFVHYLECARYWNKITDEKEIQRIALDNFTINYSIHYHTFNEKSIRDLLSLIHSQNPDLFTILEFRENRVGDTVEYIAILEKNTYVRDCLKNLEMQNTCNHIPVVQDVIVPVYNAYDDVIRCLYSLVKYQTNYRIILIDDCSADERISGLFALLKPFESSRFILLKNESNRGFVKTVNRGMHFSHSDVILLNSDTIVTEGWAEKIFSCAYRDETTGTVTPFTNNGTICSLPNFCENNTIPEGFTIDGFSGLVEKHSFRKYYEIPTAVGFCMFIKRTLLDKTGFFDEDAFGKGYGEENDFCIRAIQAGYRNVLCDDTFVFHKGEASFSAEKQDLSKKNMQILVQKYPDYLRRVSEFCQKNPIRPFQKFIKTKVQTEKGFSQKKSILYILHNLGGGSEKHVLELVHTLSSKFVFYIVKVQDLKVHVTEFKGNEKREKTFTLSEPVNGTLSTNTGYREIMKKILLSSNIGLIHIQHLLGHPLDILPLAGELEIPVFFTVHDFYSVCPRINLLDETATFCHSKSSTTRCRKCLTETMNTPPGFIDEWRTQFSSGFERIQLVIAPSRSTIEILGKYFPGILDKYQIIEHGHGEDLFVRMQQSPSAAVSSKFHIAYFGILAPHKGRELFYNLAKAPELSGITKWSIFGISDLHSLPGYYPDTNITIYGSYDGFKGLQQKVNENAVDLVIFPTKCPETFSFTLSEAWALGIPVLVSNIGALNERVINCGGGWTADMNNAESIKKMIRYIFQNREEYLQKKGEISKSQLKSLKETTEIYSFIYSLTITNTHSRRISKRNHIGTDVSESLAFDTYDTAETTNPSNLSIPIKECKTSLYQRMVLCYRENGIIYTIRHCFIFLYEHL